MVLDYDIIVIGGGHAGCEAASAAARLGSRTLLLTMDMVKFAEMSCNPAVGGVAKGQIVREIDALGGQMGRITDLTTLQFRMLNRSKGAAMWSPRAQCDKRAFSAEWRRTLENTDNLYILPASQTRDKDALTYHGVGLVMKELSDMGFEYIVCDSPAGIEAGALIALYYSDEAIVTTNPEVSSVRDSDRIIGILNARSRRAEQNLDPVIPKLLLTRYIPERVDKGEMLSNDDIQELLSIPLLGIIPESPDVLKASNTGETIILNQASEAGQAYNDAVERLLGKEVPFRFYQAKKKGFLAKLFGGGD